MSGERIARIDRHVRWNGGPETRGGAIPFRALPTPSGVDNYVKISGGVGKGLLGEDFFPFDSTNPTSVERAIEAARTALRRSEALSGRPDAGYTHRPTRISVFRPVVGAPFPTIGVFR